MNIGKYKIKQKNKKLYWQYYKQDLGDHRVVYYKFNNCSSDLYIYNCWRIGHQKWMIVDHGKIHSIIRDMTKISEEQLMLELL